MSEIRSMRQEQIANLQIQNTQTKDGCWPRIMRKTSEDGFTHGNPRLHSPIKQATYTKGSWEDFIRRSDFIIQNQGIRIPEHPPGNFNVSDGIVALVEEKDMFNIRSLNRIKVSQKHSQVFDAQRKTYSTQILSDSDIELWNQRYRSDYTKYHHNQSTSAVTNSTTKAEYTGSYLAIANAKRIKLANKSIQMISNNTKNGFGLKETETKQISLKRADSLCSYKSEKINEAIGIQQSPKQFYKNSSNSRRNSLSSQSSFNSKIKSQCYQKIEISDFEKKVKPRKPLPTSDIQLQFLEFKRNYDSIVLG